MNFAPYQWRANKGYLPPPDSMPAPIYPGTSPYYIQGPIPIRGLATYAVGLPQSPPASLSGPVIAVPPPPPSAASIPTPAPPAPSIKKVTIDKTIAILPSIAPGESSTGGSKESRSVNSANPEAPPSVRPGVNYLFPRTHTMLHIFSKAAPIWEGDKYKGQKLAFKMFKVSTAFTVRNVVERVLRKDVGGCEGWGVTEVVERGDGGWGKGTTIKYTTDKAEGNLESMGWNARRGKEMPPVWLVVHKV